MIFIRFDIYSIVQEKCASSADEFVVDKLLSSLFFVADELLFPEQEIKKAAGIKRDKNFKCIIIFCFYFFTEYHISLPFYCPGNLNKD